MRTSVTVFAIILVLAAPVFADDAGQDALEAIGALQRVVNDDAVKWQERWKAYKKAKDAIDGIPDEGQKKAAQEAYDAIQGQVAKGLHRETLPVSGWVMGFFGATLLWGGFMVCVGIAVKMGKGQDRVDPRAE